MSLRFHQSGYSEPWRFERRPQDASLRYMKHGKVRPMQEPGFLARLFGRAGR